MKKHRWRFLGDYLTEVVGKVPYDFNTGNGHLGKVRSTHRKYGGYHTDTAYRYIIPIHPTDTSYRYILPIHHTDTAYRYIIPIHPTDASYRHILPIHHTDTAYRYIIPIHPTDTSYRYILPNQKEGGCD